MTLPAPSSYMDAVDAAVAEALAIRGRVYGIAPIVEEACRGAWLIDPADHFRRPMMAVEEVAAEAVLTWLVATVTLERITGCN